MVAIKVRVVPRAAKDEVLGVMGGQVLKVRIQAPPVEGKANAHLIKFLAGHWNISRGSIHLAAGKRGRSKSLQISNPPAEFVKELLSIKPC